MRLTMAGATDWRYLMVTDPLPAGTEAIQDDTSYPLEKPGSAYASQIEYRDQKTVFFREHLDEPRVEYVYLLKIVAAGTFRASPASIMQAASWRRKPSSRAWVRSLLKTSLLSSTTTRSYGPGCPS